MVSLEALQNLGCALACGLAIGAEREWHHRSAGLRTCALVATGSALFVLIAVLTPAESSPTRVAAQIVTGIGFLGAGVIMRSGVNVHGIDTAATIWCAASVGSLAGSGLLSVAFIGSAAVLLLNMVIRPLVPHFHRHGPIPREEAFRYLLQVMCTRSDASQVRILLVQLTSASPLVLEELESADTRTGDLTVLKVILSATEPQTTQLEQITRRLCLERHLSSVRWQVLPRPVPD